MLRKPLPAKFYQLAKAPKVPPSVNIKPQHLIKVSTNHFNYQDENLDLPFVMGEPVPYDLAKAYLIKEDGTRVSLAQYLMNDGSKYFKSETSNLFVADMRPTVVLVPEDNEGKGHFQMALKNIDEKSTDANTKHLLYKVSLLPVLEEKHTFRLYNNQEAIAQWLEPGNAGLPASDNCFTATTIADADVKKVIRSKTKADQKKVAEIFDQGVVILSGLIEFKVDLVAKKAREDAQAAELQVPESFAGITEINNRNKYRDELETLESLVYLESKACDIDVEFHQIKSIKNHSKHIEADGSNSKSFFSGLFGKTKPQAAPTLPASAAALPAPAPEPIPDTKSTLNENAVITSSAIQMNYRTTSYGEGSYSLLGKLQMQFIQGISCPANPSLANLALTHAATKIQHTALLYDLDLTLFNQDYVNALAVTLLPKEMLCMIFNFLLDNNRIYHNFRSTVNLSEYIERTGNPMVAKKAIEQNISVQSAPTKAVAALNSKPKKDSSCHIM